MSFIKGNFKKEIFSSSSNGYLIGLFKVKEASEDLKDWLNQTISFTGYFPDLNEIDTYLFEGKKVHHAKYGDQFAVDHFERMMPKENNAMVEVLSSDLFPGIGAKTAEKIVNVFHEDTFEVILHHPSDLICVPSITQKQVDILHQGLLSYQGSYEAILKLTEYGFTTKESMKIYHFYKENAVRVLMNDVYQIYYDLDDISFSQIDRISFAHDLAKDDPRRVKAAIVYVMRELTNTVGHTYFLQEEIIPFLSRVLKKELEKEKYQEAFLALEKEERLVNRSEKWYLKEYYDAEIFIARRLRMLAHTKKKELKKINTYLSEIEKQNAITYNEEQKRAMKEAIISQVVVITGGPGTGKTTIIRGILDLYRLSFPEQKEKLEENITLLAPTGRASKRMSEATAFPASTIHRFLKWNKDTNRFQVNEYHKSNTKFVIVDETSMVDTLLLSNLLKGLSSNCKVVFVGDADQLPSVGAGEVLKDLIESEELEVIDLKNLYRQGKDSHIITLAHEVKEGIVDPDIFRQGEDLQFLSCPDDQVLEAMKEICKDYKSNEVQILAPMYKTQNGIDNINKEMQKIWNPKALRKKEITSGDVIYREEDKVIQLSNRPDDFVFNGDIGYIETIKTLNKKEIYVDFDSNLVKYTPAMFSKLAHAYAISIHKSQGSEFEMVIVPLVMAYHKMLYRKLLYTGITRSKKKLILIGDFEAFSLAVLNNQERKRKTTLGFYLKNGII